MSEIILALPVVFPIVGGLAMLFHQPGEGVVPWNRRRALLTAGLVLLNSFFVAAILVGGVDGERRLVVFKLYSSLTVMFKLDRMGALFAGMVAFLWPLATLYAFEYMEHEERRNTFFAFYLMTYGVTVGIALAGTLVTLYLFYEMLTFVTLPLVMFPLTKEAVRASRAYLYYSIGGAAFAFIGMVFVLGFSSIETSEFVAGGMLDLARAGQNRNTLLLVYVLAFFGFGVKAAVFPLYRWLPKAAVAPTPVTALLHAVAVVKSGAFAILRLTYFSFGIGFLRGSWAQWVVMCATLVTILFGSTMAVKEVHWKRRLAYSTVSNLSYILLGLSMLNATALTGSLLHVVFHAVIKSALFLSAGALIFTTGRTKVNDFVGLGRKMPVLFWSYTIVSLGLIGIPPTSGVISKWYLATGCLESGMAGLSWIGPAALLISALLTAGYLLPLSIRGFLMEPDYNAVHNDYREPRLLMLAPVVILAVITLVLGLYPTPLIQLIQNGIAAGLF